LPPQLKTGLNEIFALQDEAAKLNFKESALVREAYEVMSDAIRFSYTVLQEMPFEATKKTAIRRLAVDCLSHAIIAMRVGLWGGLPESLGTLRGATESAAQLTFVVKEQKYSTVAVETNRKFDQISYESAFDGLGALGESMERLHGRFSNTGSHSTARRLALVDYEYDGQEYDRLGFAPSPKYAEIAVYYSMLVCMPVCDALYMAYKQEDVEFRLAQELSELLQRFEATCDKFYARVPKLKETIESQASASHKERTDDAG
jgi:hypothetical protein